MSFSNAPDVKEIANDYIGKYHQHLTNVKIEYLFTEKPIRKKGKEVLGEMKLVSGLNAFLATRDLEERPEQLFVMIISRSAWDLLVDNRGAREALVDHELAHADRDLESGALSLNPHDIEEFNDIAARHGAWKQDIANFIKAAKSAKTPMLPFDLSLARENQERDAAEREERQRVQELGEEMAAAGVTVTVAKGRRNKGQAEGATEQAATGS